MSFVEILAIIVLSFVAGSVSTIIFLINISSKYSNKKNETKIESGEGNVNG